MSVLEPQRHYGTFGRPKVRSKSEDSRSVGVCNINACIKQNIEENKWLLLGFVEEIMCPRSTTDAHLDVQSDTKKRELRRNPNM
jgi:hypothetical protein